jgi:hypothetical protein
LKKESESIQTLLSFSLPFTDLPKATHIDRAIDPNGYISFAVFTEKTNPLKIPTKIIQHKSSLSITRPCMQTLKPTGIQ